jgi:hypothetical protein
MCENFMEKENNILDSIPSTQNPFRVPDNYFADFHLNMEKQITGMRPKTNEVSLFVKIRPWIYIAASFLAFVFCIQWYIFNMVKSDELNAENNDSTEEAMQATETMLYTYVDDLSIIDYLASNGEGVNYGK